MFNKGQLSGLMKQAQAMQENMKRAQSELAALEVTGEASSGLVRVVMTCAYEVRSVTLADQALEGGLEDKEMLQDLLLLAMQDACKKAKTTSDERMAKLSAGLPAGMKLPF